MNRIIPIAAGLLLIASCKPGTASKASAVSDAALTVPADKPLTQVGKSYLGTWYRVVQKDSNNFVVFRPCGQDTQLIRVGDSSLYEQTGTEWLTTKIAAVLPIDSNTVTIKGTSASSYTFRWKNKNKFIVSWTPKYSASYPAQEYLYVDSVHAGFLKWEHEKCK
ncbi:hypothetical protein CLV59_104502 [Chitinophaga dinghuensis]|uniref:Uncharacterized protein n=1 Tax=Chitinophaga dinghuensis TaxID=1539050 RepID=A0A327VZ13_9BACT|nr:hypothetical protein [Chitinophaga dinghuensis]RAJ82277.1 hypothetical protein CLV59_104502 [Chitinophaga dinghuensis]